MHEGDETQMRRENVTQMPPKSNMQGAWSTTAFTQAIKLPEKSSEIMEDALGIYRKALPFVLHGFPRFELIRRQSRKRSQRPQTQTV